MQLPVFCHPLVPDAFSHSFIRSFPETTLEHRVVGNTGLQAGAGCILSWYDLALIQLDREEPLR